MGEPMMVSEKIVVLRNAELVVHGCADMLKTSMDVDFGHALIRVYDTRSLRIDGRYVDPDDLPNLPNEITNSRIHVINDYAEVVVVYDDKICRTWFNEEYGDIVCIDGDDMRKLRKHILKILG